MKSVVKQTPITLEEKCLAEVNATLSMLDRAINGYRKIANAEVTLSQKLESKSIVKDLEELRSRTRMAMYQISLGLEAEK